MTAPPALTLDSALAQAIDHHRNGRLAQADPLYRFVLAQKPNHPTALHLLGVLHGSAGQPQTAVDLIRRAIAVHPTEAMYHVNLGIFLTALFQHPDALAAFRQAVRLNPRLPEARIHLGGALKSANQLAEAETELREALRLRPGDAEALLNLGNVAQARGDVAAARDAWLQILSAHPDHVAALCNLGTLEKIAGNLSAALDRYRAALDVDPRNAEAHHLLGAAYQAQGNFDGAIASYQRALQFNPRLADAFNNLGVVLRTTGRLERAIDAYHAALALKPDFPEALNNLAVALQTQGKVENAIAAFNRALELRPNYAEAWCNLGSAHKDAADLDAAIACYRRALEFSPDFWEAHGNLLYTLMFHPAYDGPAILREARAFAARYADPLTPVDPVHTNDRDPARPLRIGYLSPDFRDHCQAFFTLPLLRNHDRTRFHITGYSSALVPDFITDRIKSHCDQWRTIVDLSDEQIADLVRQDNIDILVDLTMHMAGSRLLVFARKPAPVQITWLAYPGTTGLASIDYRLTDPHLDPPPSPQPNNSTDSHYAEKSLRLADTFWCYDPGPEDPRVSALPADANGRVTFGCLNNFCKITAGTLALWSRVLQTIPNARLLLLAPEGHPRENIRSHLQTAGVDPARLAFVPRLPRDQYLAVYHQIDIGLDTLPYNGHTTSLDSYWMGVPVITRVGHTVVGRAGLSQLMNLNLPELIAHTDEAFITTATQLATDLPHLRHLRETLRERLRASPLMNAPRFARAVEAAYHVAWASRS